MQPPLTKEKKKHKKTVSSSVPESSLVFTISGSSSEEASKTFLEVLAKSHNLKKTKNVKENHETRRRATRDLHQEMDWVFYDS